MNPAHIKLADAYARDVLGHARYATWIYVYAAVCGVFKEGWIPDNYYGSVVVPAIKGGYGKISDFRCLQSTIFRSAAFPDVAYFVNGLFLTPDNTPVAPHSVKHLLFAGRDEIVFKVDNSLQGRGVFFFHRTTFAWQKREAPGTVVFQKPVSTHTPLTRVAPAPLP